MDSTTPTPAQAVSERPGFACRHLGPGPEDQGHMLAELGLETLEQLAAQVVPADILLSPEQACQGLPPSPPAIAWCAA